MILFLTCGFSGQNFDNIGIDDNPNLNENETKLLNSLLDEKRDDFDFKGKKVAFLTGSSGRTIMAKYDYFKNSVILWIDDGSRPQISMIRLTKEGCISNCR